MTEQTFKIMVNGLWLTYQKSQMMIRLLENIGLIVDGEKKKSSLHELYGIMDTAGKTITDIITDMSDSIKDDDMKDDIMSKVDDLFRETSIYYMEKQDDEMNIPDEVYAELISILKSIDVKLSWENTSARTLPNSHDKYQRHSVTKNW